MILNGIPEIRIVTCTGSSSRKSFLRTVSPNKTTFADRLLSSEVSSRPAATLQSRATK